MKNNKNSVLLNSVSANLIGILGTILGIVLFAASIFLYTNSIEEADREEHIYEVVRNCTSYTNSFHKSEYALSDNSQYEANISGSTVNIKKESISNGDNELLEIENIIANCKNMELVNLCIGQIEENEEFKSYGCPINGLSVTLRYKESWTYKPVF